MVTKFDEIINMNFDIARTEQHQIIVKSMLVQHTMTSIFAAVVSATTASKSLHYFLKSAESLS
jgi:hypothetical protein